MPDPHTERSRPPSGAPRGEDGFVIMVGVAMLAIALAIGAAALGETLSSRSHANRDVRVKRALQAADAGISTLLYQQNELPLASLDFNAGPLGASAMLDCLVPVFDRNLNVTGVNASVASAGICPNGSGPGAPPTGAISFPVGAHAYYQAQFAPVPTANGNNISLAPKIVSEGFDDGGDSANTAGYAVRRVEAILAPLDPFRALEAMGNLKFTGLKTVGVDVTTALNGNARANGSVTLPPIFTNPNLSGGLIGSVTWGTAYSGPVIALSHVAQESSTFTRSPVSIAASKANCPSSCSVLFGAAYDSAHNAISTSSPLTLPAGDYVFCNFSASSTVTANSTAAAPVRIFIDSSKSTRCSGNGLGSAQGNFTAGQGVGNLLANTVGVTGATGLQIYVVGDQAAPPYDNATTVTIGGGLNLVESYVVYAPTSKVNASNCIASFTLGLETDTCQAIQGAIIGDDVTIQASAFTQDLNLTSYPLYSGLGAFHVQSFVECTPVYPLPTPDPTAGC